MSSATGKRRAGGSAAMQGSPAAESGPSLLQVICPWLAVAWLAVYWLLFFSSPLPNAQGRFPGLTRWQLASQLPVLYSLFLSSLHDSRTPSGIQFLPQRLDLLAGSAFILLAGVALGRLVLRWLGVLREMDAAARLALAGGVGLSALSLLTLALGLAGMLWQWLFVTLFAGLIGLEVVFTRGSRFAVSQKPAARADVTARVLSSESQLLSWICGGLCIPFLALMLLGAMLPETDFDVKEYHLQGPKEYLQDGRIHFLPHNVYTSFPFLTEMLSLAGMVIRGDWERGALVGKTVLMAFAPLTALGVWCVTRRFAGRSAAWLAALACLSTPWTYRISIIAYTEGAACCYVILPVLALQIWNEWRQRTDMAARADIAGPLLVGLLAGSAVSTKYPGMVFVAIPFLAAVMFTACFTTARSFRQTLIIAAYYGAGVLATFGPWMAKNAAETGNPVYPLLYSVFGGADWDDELQAKFKRGHSTPPEMFWNLRGEIPAVTLHNDWQSPLLFGLAPLAFLVPWRRAPWGLAAYAAMILAAWFLLTHRIDRFWVPVIPVLACLAGAGLWNLGRSQSAAGESEGLPLLARLPIVPAAALSLFAVIYNFGFITTALCGNNGYLADLNVVVQQSETPSMALVESLQLPAESKVLFVGDAEVFDAHFPLLYNTVFDFNLLEQLTARKTGANQWELLPRDKIVASLREQGVTHVFINWQEVLRYRTTYGYTDFVSPARLRQFEELGILKELPLRPEVAQRLWSELEPADQFQVDQWGPELKLDSGRTMQVKRYQLWQVESPPAAAN